MLFKIEPASIKRKKWKFQPKISLIENILELDLGRLVIMS